MKMSNFHFGDTVIRSTDQRENAVQNSISNNSAKGLSKNRGSPRLKCPGTALESAPKCRSCPRTLLERAPDCEVAVLQSAQAACSTPSSWRAPPGHAGMPQSARLACSKTHG